MPRCRAAAITERPTPELPAFWITQSPGASATNSLSSNTAVGGLMAIIASWRGSTRAGSANSPSAGNTSCSRHAV
jgi:hypothetical protein